MIDCKNCGYRILLAKIADIHVWKEDCDKYCTDHCKKMNERVFMGTLPEPELLFADMEEIIDAGD